MFIVKYWNGNKWCRISSVKRFWEPRRYNSKTEAADAIAGFKKEAPGFFRFRILKDGDPAPSRIGGE